MLVFVGERSILVRDELLTARAGECLLIPPRMAHAPLPFDDSVVAANLYSHAFPPGLPPTVVKSPPRARALVEEPASLVCALAEEWLEAVQGRDMPGARLPQIEPTPVLVATLARRAAMSREAFTRAFHRAHGISPQSFLQGVRLNAARRLLKDGASPADAAAAAGFADQSHLGRLFRRAFGTTPGRYRRG
jgi:AraC-like DNA-binding protein